MKTYHKAVACLLRNLKTEPEILVFIHPPPLEDLQIPKGTVEPNENIELAAIRELHEESGVKEVKILKKIVPYQIISNGGPNGDQDPEIQIWHPFIMKAIKILPDSWKHNVSGKGIDQGLTYKYLWHPIGKDDFRFHKKFNLLLKKIREEFLT